MTTPTITGWGPVISVGDVQLVNVLVGNLTQSLNSQPINALNAELISVAYLVNSAGGTTTAASGSIALQGSNDNGNNWVDATRNNFAAGQSANNWFTGSISSTAYFGTYRVNVLVSSSSVGPGNNTCGLTASVIIKG